MHRQLDEKKVIVFGAGYLGDGWSNGKAAAVAYARAGASVACVDLNLKAAEATAQCIESEGNIAVPLQADVTDLESVEAAVAAALKQVGVIDVTPQQCGGDAHGRARRARRGDLRTFDATEPRVGLSDCKVVIPHMLERTKA